MLYRSQYSARKSGDTPIDASSETAVGLDDTSQAHRKTEDTACLRCCFVCEIMSLIF